MNLYKVSYTITDAITQGIANGLFTRVGGVISESATGRVVTFLREFGGLEQVTGRMLEVLGGAATAGVLNLGLTTMGFGLVFKRLRSIEKRLQDTQEILQLVNKKIDLDFYANFNAALELAANSFGMENAENRRATALNAISGLAEAKHHYIPLADYEIAAQTYLAGEYLPTFALACVAEARCYLELEEVSTARRILDAGAAEYLRQTQRYLDVLLTPNPAAYLHPSLNNKIGMHRLIRVLQWQNPNLSEMAVFETQRENMFSLQGEMDKWIRSLPPAVWDPKVHGAAPATKSWFFGKGDPTPVFARLVAVMEIMEALIEDARRFQAYLAEVETIRQLGISFRQWRLLSPPAAPAHLKPGLIYITPTRVRVRARRAPRVRATTRSPIKIVKK